MGLPPGKKSLAEIRRSGDDADSVVELVILLDWLLATFDRRGDGPKGTRERVDRHARRFSDHKDVHFGITVRNRIVHSEPGEAAPTAAELERARRHLVRGVEDLLAHAEAKTAALAAGVPPSTGRVRGLLAVLAWFFGSWQLYAIAATSVLSTVSGTDGAVGYPVTRLVVLVAGLALLHSFWLPLGPRFGVEVRGLFRALLGSYAVGIGLFAWCIASPPAGADGTTFSGSPFSSLGGGARVLERLLGEGVYAFAPWLAYSSETLWSGLDQLGLGEFVLVSGLVLLLFGAFAFAWRPSRRAVRSGPAFRHGRLVCLALGLFLVAERAWRALG